MLSEQSLYTRLSSHTFRPMAHPWKPIRSLPHKATCTMSQSLAVQDKRIMDAIANYFNRTIREIDWDDEDKFLEVLKESM